MRRGLMAWDASELPIETIHARQGKLRAIMKAHKLDAFIAYTNISHPAAVSWISGFTPYWSEGVYCVMPEGTPAFATALSKRVAEWIGTVMPVGEVIPTPAPGTAIGKRLATAGAKRIGIIDLDDLPARQARAILAEVGGLELVDATDAFNAIRCEVDGSERALAAKAAAIAAAAMKAADWNAKSLQALIAPCEVHARRAAAEDIFLSVAPDLNASGRFQRTDTATTLGSSFALRMSLAYKGTWVRMVQSHASNPAEAARFATAQKAFDLLMLSRDPEPAVREALAAAGADLKSWSLEQPRGSSPLVCVAGTGITTGAYNAGAPATFNAECEINGARWLASRPFA